MTFNAGTEAIEALFAGAIDATFIGPNPAINAFAQSDGEAMRIVSGTTSGGASLVVREGIDAPEDLEGKTLATPSLGNTQDVALRAWLKEQGYETDTSRRRRRRRSSRRTTPTRSTAFQDGAHRRRLGARAVGDPPRAARAAATSWSTRPTCGPRASSSPPT